MAAGHSGFRISGCDSSAKHEYAFKSEFCPGNEDVFGAAGPGIGTGAFPWIGG
jgi:hypothetical protein